MMSILTPKMVNKRDIDRARSEKSKCAVWFPRTDGSGTTMTDVVNNVVITDASAAHNEPHAVTFGKTAGAVTSGTFPALKENFVLVLCQETDTSEGFALATIGGSTFVSVTAALASCDYGAGAGNGVATSSSALGSTTGQTVTTAAAVIGDTIYHYGSVAGAGISENDNADASGFTAAFSAGNPVLNASVSLSSIAVRQHIYGVALWTFEKGTYTTGQVIAALDEIDDKWPLGKKYLPEL